MAKVKQENSSNVGKTFTVFALSVLKVLLLLKAFVGKTLAILQKFAEM